MSVDAYLPCFACGKVLPNAFPEADNQPWGGTEFRTQGHYGSTFWDSFDGEDLVLNVCDDCLRAHTARLGQQKAFLPVCCAGLSGFGGLPVDRPLLAYTGHRDDDRHTVDVEDLGVDPAVRWVPDIAERKAHLESKGQ